MKCIAKPNDYGLIVKKKSPKKLNQKEKNMKYVHLHTLSLLLIQLSDTPFIESDNVPLMTNICPRLKLYCLCTPLDEFMHNHL